MNPHTITYEFEKALCRYTDAPYAVAVDNCSNALFLALYLERKRHGFDTVYIPKHTYPSVPCEAIHAGYKVKFMDSPEYLTGAYALSHTMVVDSSLHFTAGMYQAHTFMCLSFTGPYKHLKLGKGGAILTDDIQAYRWLKKARYSGRNECSYLEDDLTMLGWNFYMPHETAAKGLQLIQQFYDESGRKSNPPLTHRYPDLSKFKIYEGS